MDVDDPNMTAQPARTFPARSALANLAMYNDSQARATSSPLSDVPEGAGGMREKASVSFNDDGRDESEGVTQQELIDALRAAAQGRLPLGGVTLPEENRPEDVPRGLRYSEEEVRHGVRFCLVASLEAHSLIVAWILVDPYPTHRRPVEQPDRPIFDQRSSSHARTGKDPVYLHPDRYPDQRGF